MVRDMQNRAILYSEELSFRIKLWLRKKLQSGGDIGWSPPYWFKRISNWYFVPDNTQDKCKIVKAVFEMYATWYYWQSGIAQTLRHDYRLKRFSKRSVEAILKNSIYAWYRTKHRRLSKEEFMFWWYEKAWTYTEIYELNHIQPIISKELFDTCQEIKQGRNKLKSKPSGVARFPALFTCSCWRNMRRDDKKNNKYLRCTNHINNKFPIRCAESYINFKVLDPLIDKIIRDLIPHKELREKMTEHIQKEMKLKAVDKNRKLTERLSQSCELQEKLEEVADKFVVWIIDNKEYRLLSDSLRKKISEVDNEVSALQDFTKYRDAWRKIIDFLQILEKDEQYLSLSDLNKKSSQRYGVLFHIVANLTLTQWKVSSYKLFEPFNILKKGQNAEWWRMTAEFWTVFSISLETAVYPIQLLYYPSTEARYESVY